MTATDWADLTLLSLALFAVWLLVFAPIPGDGDDHDE